MLGDCEGIDLVEHISQALIRVHYQINHVCLADIENLLEERGFHLDNNLLHRMRRALVHYMEETQRINLGCGRGESNCTTKVFINSYRRRDHGCQDERPKHWRRYLWGKACNSALNCANGRSRPTALQPPDPAA